MTGRGVSAVGRSKENGLKEGDLTQGWAIDGLRAVAHPLRFQILQAIGTAERNVGQIERMTGILQPALSQQLAVLRKADLVATRKSAKLVFYHINAQRLGELSQAINMLADVSGAPPHLRHISPTGAASFARMD